METEVWSRRRSKLATRLSNPFSQPQLHDGPAFPVDFGETHPACRVADCANGWR
jgi:hypothetical protein